MNNILTFEDYKKMNIRKVESVIYRQFVEENIKNENKVNEGFIRNFINKRSSKFIQDALGDEIEKGKELEKSIKEALDGLNKGFEEVGKNIDANAKAKPNIEAIEKVKEAIKKVQSQAFDTLTMIGSEGEIDFAGFMGSASVAAVANFGILFSPIRSVFITRKAYKYFLGIIKQTIRRNLLIIQLNFDQFENLILQKSFESQEDSEFGTRLTTLNDFMRDLTEQLCGEKTKFLKPGKNKELKDKIEIVRKNTEQVYRERKINSQNNPFSSLWQDQHNNTYTRTLEQLKQYINEDSQKELDALKNSITKMSGNDVELVQYGELLISAAEEYAIKTNHGINNNFIKMSSVFNLENQKKLIQLITDAQKEAQEEIERKKNELKEQTDTEKINESIERGKKIYEDTLKDSTKDYTLDMFEEEFGSEGVNDLRAFFRSEDGQEAYKDFIEKNPLYKYLILDDITLNNLLNSINDLKVVEISDTKEFFDTIVKKEYALYYMMAERSLKDAVESVESTDYFGFDIPSDMVKENTLLFESYYGSPLLELINERKREAGRSYQTEYGDKDEEKTKELKREIKELKRQISNIKDKDNGKNKEEIEKLENLLNIANDKYNRFMGFKTIDRLKALEKAIEELKKRINNYINLDDVEDSDVEDSDVEDSDVEDSDIEDSDVEDSDIEDSDVEDSDVEDSDVEDSDVEDSDIEDSDVEDSDVEDSDIEDSDVEDSDVEDSDSDNGDSESEERNGEHYNINNILFPKGENIKKRYFLTFSGSGNGLFDILHKDFKTTIFTEDKNYVDDISADSKLTIFKIIHNQLKFGKSIAPQFAEYLIRLEAHMLLKNQDPWFVVKDNTELIKEKECFDINAKKIKNKKAFVEINQDDFIDIKKFLEKFHTLSENDFALEEKNKKEEKE